MDTINLLEIINTIIKKNNININQNINNNINNNFNLCDFNLNNLGSTIINKDIINKDIINEKNLYYILFNFIYDRNDIKYNNILNDFENDIKNNRYKINKQYIFNNNNIIFKYIFKKIKFNLINDNILDDEILLFLSY